MKKNVFFKTITYVKFAGDVNVHIVSIILKKN